jgi:hypothetical protein
MDLTCISFGDSVGSTVDVDPPSPKNSSILMPASLPEHMVNSAEMCYMLLVLVFLLC